MRMISQCKSWAMVIREATSRRFKQAAAAAATGQRHSCAD
ncbi:hypothetical protein HaLaN_09200, partial [Haematococcus lacustris]